MTLLMETVNTPRRCAPGRLQLRFAARTDQVCHVRHAVADYVRRLGWSDDEAEEVVLAVGEACNNAVSYGRAEAPDACITLRAYQTPPGQICLEIRNPGGRFRPDLAQLRLLPGAHAVHGRGFALMDALMDQVCVCSEGDETVVRLVKRAAQQRAA